MQNQLNFDGSTPLHAFDQDLGINSPLHYSITAGNGMGVFSIDPATGLIYQTKEVLRSSQNSSEDMCLKFCLLPGWQGNNDRWQWKVPATDWGQTAGQPAESSTGNCKMAVMYNKGAVLLHFISFQVEVDVEDINDNIPLFEVEQYNMTVVENLPRNFEIMTFVARDADEVIWRWKLLVTLSIVKKARLVKNDSFFIKKAISQKRWQIP